MKIRLRTNYSSPAITARAGDIIDVPDSEAKDLLEGKYAVAVTEEKPEPKKPVPRPKPKVTPSAENVRTRRRKKEE